MKDQNLPGGSAGILARLLAAIALLLVVFAANASSGDDMCFSLYAKSGAARGTKACRLDVVGNTPGGMGNYACINNLELIDQWCAGADADQPEKSCPVADPVYPGSGAVTLSETDFVSGDDIPLQLTRTYRSTPLAKNVSAMGPVWFHSWQRSLGLANANSWGSSKVLAYRENGEPVTFNWSAGTWRTAAFSGLTLAQNGSGWTLADLTTGTTETYSAQGVLLSERTRTGFVRTLTYDGSGRLAVLTQHGDDAIAKFDLTLRFDYDDKGRLIRLTDPANGLTQYG